MPQQPASPPPPRALSESDWADAAPISGSEWDQATPLKAKAATPKGPDTADKVAQFLVRSLPFTEGIAPYVTADRALSLLPAAGAVVGDVAGDPSGMLGAGSGEAIRQLISRGIGHDADTPLTSEDAAARIRDQAVAGGVGKLIPISLKAIAPAAKNFLQDAYQMVSGITDSAAARDIMNEGRMATIPRNTTALQAKAAAQATPAVAERVIRPAIPETTIPGRPAMRIPEIPEHTISAAQPDVVINEVPTSTLGPGRPRMVIRGQPAVTQPGQPAINLPAKPPVTVPGSAAVIDPARPAIPGALQPAADAHAEAVARPASVGERAMMSGLGYILGGPYGLTAGAVPAIRPVGTAILGGVNQAINQAGPIGEMLRYAIMMGLAQKPTTPPPAGAGGGQ